MKRIPNLDGLRAIAIFLVLLVHAATYVDASLIGVRMLMGTGWNGVFLFFVLSGFLVGSLAFKELSMTGTIDLPRFWIRRFFRTWPLYFLLLFLNYWRHSGEIRPPFWRYLTFTQNFSEPYFFTVTWSLAVEEQFYLFLPVLLLLIAVIVGTRWILPAIGAGFLGAFVFRYLNGSSYHTLAVVDSLLVGLALAYLDHFHPGRLRQWLRMPNALFAIGLGVVYLPFLTTVGPMREVLLNGGQAVGFGLIVASALNPRLMISSLLSCAPARYLALISYSIYLSHDWVLYHVGHWVKRMELSAGIACGLVVVLLTLGSVVLGSLLYQFVERPGMKLRDRLSPRRTPVPAN